MHDPRPSTTSGLSSCSSMEQNVQDHLVVTALGGGLHLLHLGGGLFTDATNVSRGNGPRPPPCPEWQSRSSPLPPRCGRAQPSRSASGNHAAILRHGLRELQVPMRRASLMMSGFVPGDERAQDHLVGHPVDDVQVGEGLAGNLANAPRRSPGADLGTRRPPWQRQCIIIRLSTTPIWPLSIFS